MGFGVNSSKKGGGLIFKDQSLSQLAFESLPIWMQTMLSIVTLGGFWIAKLIYSLHKKEQAHMKQRLHHLEQQQDEMHYLLVTLLEKEGYDPRDILEVYRTTQRAHNSRGAD